MATITRARARRAEKGVMILTITSIFVVLIYDRSSYREKVIKKSDKHIDWTPWSKNIDLRKTDSKDTLMDYFNWSNQQSCKRPHLMGGKTGHYICLDPPAIPRTFCLAYSFDFFHDWHFEKEMKDYFCQVYSFDPAILEIKLKSWTGLEDDFIGFLGYMKLQGPSNRTDDMKKYNGKMPKTFESIHRVLKRLMDEDETKILDYLKLDIEGEEWDIIPMMLKSGLFSQIRQMSLRINLFQDDLEYYRDTAAKIRSIESEGLIRFHSKEIPCSNSRLRAKWPEDKTIIFPLKCIEMAWYQVIPY